MATSRISPDADAVVTEIEMAAPPERVFEALIDRKQVMQWWTSEQCAIEGFEMERRVGGRWRYDSKEGTINVTGVTKFHCEGEVLEYDPPRQLAYTWIANWHEDKKLRTVVRWELTPVAGGTRVKVTHSGLAKEQVARLDYGKGWGGLVDQLRRFVERGGAAAGAKGVSDADAIESEIHIAAPAERVFQALVDLCNWSSGGDKRACTKARNTRVSCKRVGNGKVRAWVPTATGLKRAASMWRSIDLGCSCTRGWRVGRAISKRA